MSAVSVMNPVWCMMCANTTLTELAGGGLGGRKERDV